MRLVVGNLLTFNYVRLKDSSYLANVVRKEPRHAGVGAAIPKQAAQQALYTQLETL